MPNINLPLSDELLARIDEVRVTPVGNVPRVAWIRIAIEHALNTLDAVAATERRNDGT